jgi:hypothetical protein
MRRLVGPGSIPVTSSHNNPTWNQRIGSYENTTTTDPSNAEGATPPRFPAGDTHGPLNSAPDEVTGCTAADLDYDGTSYWRDWPNSVVPDKNPSPMLISRPTTVAALPIPRCGS